MMKQTTLAGAAADIEKFEQQQQATPPAETSTTTVTPSGDLQNGEQPAAPTQEPEPDIASFELPSIGEETENTGAPEPEQPKYNWREEMKKADPKEIMKELGLTDFAVEINNHLINGGKAEDYLAAKAIDWNKVTDEDLVKDDLRKQYPNFSPQDINRLFNRKYGVSEDATEEEKEDRALELKADAYTKRQSRIAEQQRFKFPEPIQNKNEELDKWKSDVDNYRQEIDKERTFINSHTATNSLHQSKRVAINVGKDIAPFNFQIDKPEVITKVLTDDGSAWRRLTSTETGEPDVQKQQLITLFAFNPQKFISDIFNYGVHMGTRKQVGEGQNIHRQTGPNLDGQPQQGFKVVGQGRLKDQAR